MAVNFERLGPRVTITREDGTSRVLPLEMLDGGDYLDIAQSPDEGFPPPIFIGTDPSQRTDVRTRQQLLRDWRRGMGEDEYDETQGASSFRYSQCDTRFKNVVVCRPLPVRLGNASTVNTTGTHARLVYVGSTARWFAYCDGGEAKAFRESDDTWAATGLTAGSLFCHQSAGGIFYIWDSQQQLSFAPDGLNWFGVELLDIDLTMVADSLWGVAVHDGKVFVLYKNQSSSAEAFTFQLWQSADALTAYDGLTDPIPANWTQLGSVILAEGERPCQLFVWRFPPDPARPGLFLQTNRRLFWYDDTADAASVTAWKQWHPWDMAYPASALPFALTWGRTGDLYAMPSTQQDKLWQFTGSTIAAHGPNARGGLPPARQGVVTWAAANSHSIVAWVQAGASIGAGNAGMVVALNEQEGWHHVFDTTNTGIIGSGRSVIGGGLGPTSVLTVLDNGQVWEQEFFETDLLPQYATTARSYDSTALTHDTAKMDLGSSNLNKALLYHEMNASIPTGATVAVSYRLDDDDQAGAWTALATATDATAMPWRAGFPAATEARQVELRYTLTRGTATSATPIVYSGILHTTLLPPARFNTVFRVDLRDERFRQLVRTVRGYGLADLHTFLLACHGQMLAFTVHHPADGIAVARGQAAVTPILDPVRGRGRYTIQVRDLTTPTSGV